MSHYFTNDEIKSEEKKIKVNINGTPFGFITDNGVFSKNGLDFGTRSLLENIDIESIEGDVLDFGCGWGAIGIYISKIKSIRVDMVDINERALNLSKKNSSNNKVQTNVFKSDKYENIKKKYDYIITNPPVRVGKEILYEIIFESLNHLKRNGKLYFVINKNQGAKSLMKEIEAKSKVTLIKKNKGFYVISAKNRWLFKQKSL